MVTMTTADKVLKNYYLPAVTDILNFEANPFLARIKQTTSDVVGKDIKKVIRHGLNGGISAGTETGELPNAQSNEYIVLTSSLKNLYGSIEITDKAMRASATNEGAFVNLLNDEMDGLIKSANYNFGRMLFGNGTGAVATINSSTTSSIFVNTLAGLSEGMIVDVCQPNGTVLEKGKKITAIDRSNNKVAFKEPMSKAASAGDILVIQGSYGLEMTGLDTIFNQSINNLYGVSRTDNPYLYPQITTGVGELTQNVIQKAIDSVEEASGRQTNFILCSWGVKRALAQMLSANNQNIDTMELKGGYRAITFNGIPVVADRFCPKGTMYLLNTDEFGLHQLCDWQWLEGEDGKILKQVAGKPIYTATLVKYAELMCYNPSAQAMLSGITEA